MTLIKYKWLYLSLEMEWNHTTVYFFHIMFAEFDNDPQLCSSKGFKYFSLSLPFPSIIFAFTGLHLAYHNKQMFKFDADTGHDRVNK